MWDILLCGDIEKAYLQIKCDKIRYRQDEIRENERKGFHWVKNCEPNCVEINRFTRLVFGLTQFPFILEARLKTNFRNYLMDYPKVMENISHYMYVDDLTSGG